MKMPLSFYRTALAATFLIGGATFAQAEMSATAMTDLNVRAGPGPQYPSVGLATRGSVAMLDGCIEGSRWCRVDVNGVRGWAYAKYLSVDQGGASVVVEEHRDALSVPVVTYETTSSIEDPTYEGELIGPVDEIDAITPPETVRTYIDETPMDPVYLEGEVVVGAAVPETVTFTEVPDYEYRYTRINGQPVLVDPGTRRIVYVYR